MTYGNEASLLDTLEKVLIKLSDLENEVNDKKNEFYDSVEDLKSDCDLALKSGLSDEADIIKRRIDVDEAALADYNQFLFDLTCERIKVRAAVFKLNEASTNFLKGYSLQVHRDELARLMSLLNNAMNTENSEK